MLAAHFGCQIAVMVGALLSGLDIVASALARTITDIYITSTTGLELWKHTNSNLYSYTHINSPYSIVLNNFSLQQEGKLLKDSVTLMDRNMAFDVSLSNLCHRAWTVGVIWIMLGCVLPQVYLVPYATHYNTELECASYET